MGFTSFEVSPLVNTNICHLCFGTGSVKPIQKKQLDSTTEKNDKHLSCHQCGGKGVISGNLLLGLM